MTLYFVLGLILIYCMIYLVSKFLPQDNFFISTQLTQLTQPTQSEPFQQPYPYNPSVPSVMSNYEKISTDIDNQNEYKKNLSVGLSPTPTIKCDELTNKNKCNQYGCNWFDTYCSAIYPSYL